MYEPPMQGYVLTREIRRALSDSLIRLIQSSARQQHAPGKEAL
jgi:hypothetical protein